MHSKILALADRYRVIRYLIYSWTAGPEGLQRIYCAIEQTLRTRQHLAALSTGAGLSLTGIRL
jgi:hypothetical protein